MRIVSLVPSLTHLLVDLGLKDAIVGCTKFCVQPPDLHRTATLCGGTKDPDLERIRAVGPTHILVNDEENKPEHIEQLQAEFSVCNTFPKAPDDIPEMIAGICDFLAVPDRSGYAAQVRQLLLEVRTAAADLPPKKFAYFIWKNPWMTAGSDTYISRMLELLGWENVFKAGNRYPEVSLPVVENTPDLLLFSTEPYPFRKRDLLTLKEEWPGHPEVLKADGMLASWYGSMTITALQELKKYCRGEPQQFFSEL